MNLRVKALSPNSLLVTWDPPRKRSDSLTGYKLVFFPVQAHQKKRTHVELFVGHITHHLYVFFLLDTVMKLTAWLHLINRGQSLPKKMLILHCIS